MGIKRVGRWDIAKYESEGATSSASVAQMWRRWSVAPCLVTHPGSCLISASLEFGTRVSAWIMGPRRQAKARPFRGSVSGSDGDGGRCARRVVRSKLTVCRVDVGSTGVSNGHIHASSFERPGEILDVRCVEGRLSLRIPCLMELGRSR